MVVKPAEDEHGRQITLPVVGTITMPECPHLAFYVVLVSMGALGVVEWPVVAIVGVGHLLASQTRFPRLREAGEAVESA